MTRPGLARVPEPAGTDTRPTSEVRVWTHGQVLRLHGTTMLLDSITGIPVTDSLACDACRIGVPLSEVDSVFMEREFHKDLRASGQAVLVFAFLYWF